MQVLDDRVQHLEGRVRELEESGGEFRRALNRLGDALAATHDLPALLGAVTETCALYLRAPSAAFFGLVSGTGRLRALASCRTGPGSGSGVADRWPGPEGADGPAGAAELSAGEGLAGVAAAGESVIVWSAGGAGGRAGGAGAAGRLGAGAVEGKNVPAPAPVEAELAAAGAGPGAALATAIAAPVRSGGRPFGVLALYGRSIDRPYSDEDVEALATIVRAVEPAIENTFLYDEARRLSITDGLTSLWNRRQFDLRLNEEVRRSVRFREPFSVVLLDLDQMKAVNDTYGHQAGDALLIEVAQRITGGVRDVDVVARYGGDEFALILPATGVAGALRLADKVRALLADRPFDLGPSPVPVTASLGVASYPEHGRAGRDLVGSADAALYRAKHAGGNRVEHAKVAR